MIDNRLQLYDKEALLDRLSDGVIGSGKKVIFVTGSPMTAPHGDSRYGIANVQSVVELIRDQFLARPARLEALDRELSTSKNRYQSAFKFLTGGRGQDAANKIVKQAVSGALLINKNNISKDTICSLTNDQLANLDKDTRCWHLSPGVDALGQLIADFSETFGKAVVTSNFDPLIEVAINKHGGSAWRTSLSADGAIENSTANGCQVIHIHGYWHGNDTLHTGEQLLHSRPTLKNSLLKLLEDKIVVVLAYGGWPDIFTGALNGLVSNNNLFPEILWAAYEDQPKFSDYLLESLASGINRNRVTFYAGINCHTFIPDLLAAWHKNKNIGRQENSAVSRSNMIDSEREIHKTKPFKLPTLECDRPPNIDVWVGRESELRSLETSNAKVVAFCGIGGQGKSVLAARYLQISMEEKINFERWDWRDCKEEGDRIRTQITEIISRYSGGSIKSEEICELSDIEISELLIDITKNSKSIFVFDNVDKYVDLEFKKFTGILDTLVGKLSNSATSNRLIITCRPDIHYDSSEIITFSVQGISEDEAIELFKKRANGEFVPEIEIKEAHTLTKGHAFWLDLMATQVAKVPGTTLRKLLDNLRRGRGDGPDVLSSIWDTLAQREQMVLRFMAETMRPETENTIEKFVSSELNYNKFKKSLKSLISLNLIVVKPETNAPDLYDLHPLVRQFIRARFERNERNGFIRVVLTQYEFIIGSIESMLSAFLPLPMLERWSQKAELEITAGLHEQAFDTLHKVENAMLGGGHIEEFIRISRILFESIDWETAATKFKRFDHLIGATVNAFDQLGEYEKADELLSRFELTIPKKTARFIKYCDIKAHSYWVRLNFSQAIEWASQGDSLKNETNVDTSFDCAHSLALAQRDNGEPLAALEFFLKNYALTDLTDPNSNVAVDDGPALGNVGRCLHLVKDFDGALVCYKKSIRALQGDTAPDLSGNRAYARQWIGEVLESKKEYKLAISFYQDAINSLGRSSPVRTARLLESMERLKNDYGVEVSASESTKIVGQWIRS